MTKKVNKNNEKKKDLYDLSNNKWCNLEEFIKEKTIAIKKRLWIVSPFIANQKYLKKTFNIDKLKTIDNFDFRLLTDINHVNCLSPADLLHYIRKQQKLRSLANVHAKIYIIDDTAVITSANMTENGMSINYEAGVANIDIKKGEEIFLSYWDNEQAKEIGQGELSVQLKKEAQKIHKNKTKSYEIFVKSFCNFAEKYRKCIKDKNINTKTLYYEIDDFLNFLYHKPGNEVSKAFDDEKKGPNIKEENLNEYYKKYLKWKQTVDEKNAKEFFNSKPEKSDEDMKKNWNTIARREYTENTVKNMFSDEQFDRLSLKDIANFLGIHMNTFKAIGNNKDWPKKILDNDLEEVKQYIKSLKNCKNAYDAEKIIKKRKKQKVKYLGSNTSYELLGFFENDFPIRNGNTNAGLRFFGYNVSNCK